MRLKTFFSASPTAVTLLLALYFPAALNFLLVRKAWAILSSAQGESLGPLFFASVPLFFVACFIILCAPFVVGRVTKPFFIALLLISALVNYATFQFGVIFNKDMIANIFETNSGEAASYLNPKFVLFFLLDGILPALLLLFTDIKGEGFAREAGKKALLMLAAAAALGLIGAGYYKDYASIGRNNPKLIKDIVPTYYISSTFKYLRTRFHTPLPYRAIGADAARTPADKDEHYLTVVLLGETARSANYELNGYGRGTNAYTRGIPNVLSFRDVSSCGTATAVSVPCMFSFLGRAGYAPERAEAQDNVVDTLAHGGVQTAWLDNDGGCKGVCRNIPNALTIDIPALQCTGEECTDEVFLKVMDEKIAGFNGKDGVLFLHLIGSHGPTYYKRYPEGRARFKPDCATSDLQSCSREQIVNSYDNTILFTDYVMAQVIEKLKPYDSRYQTAVLYVSDHGESLGENGIYLHGMPYAVAPAEQTHVPLMVWFSDRMKAHKRLDMNCLKRTAATGAFSHDNLSHTLLGLMDIHASVYDPQKDVLAACEGK